MAAKPQKMPKVAKVKDKSPAEIQITAEQLLREAKERELEIVPPPPKQKISDPEELQEYRLKKRKVFEDNVRKNRGNVSNWLKYSKWEEEQGEVRRARSVYERSLDVDHRNITLWLKYANMEMRNRQVNHSRNVWDRAVTVLPRANQFWYKYTYMEEMLKNVAGCREVFERWMEWAPDEQAWMTYIKFELRYQELDRARNLYERFVMVHADPKNWIKFAKFEESNGYIRSSRRVFERAVYFFGDEDLEESLFCAFARFEQGQREHDRARVIYRYALDKLSRDKCLSLYHEYTRHEKKFGDRASIDDVITSKRRFQYEEALTENPHEYDTWFDYVRMLEADGDYALIRDVYERAIATVPPVKEKRHWKRYIYLWIYYAIFEELTAKDPERTRQVYQMCLKLIPHKMFTFAEIWLLYAKFEIRQRDLVTARKYLGQALGMCPKNKLFRGYIDLEIKLREFDRCRKLYEKWLEFNPENCKTWIQFATLEAMLSDGERARGIYELAVGQTRLDMPEYLWKSYIDFETEQEEWDRVRMLYERLLERTSHVKVWISFARSEIAAAESEAADDENEETDIQKVSEASLAGLAAARTIFERANRSLRSMSEKEQRVALLEAWMAAEKDCGADETAQGKVIALMPRTVTRRRQVATADGQSRWNEYVDYVFPDDEAAKPSLMLLAKAKLWAKKREEGEDMQETKEDETEKDEKTDDVEVKEEEEPDRDLDRDSDVDIGSSDSSSSDSESESSSDSSDSSSEESQKEDESKDKRNKQDKRKERKNKSSEREREREKREESTSERRGRRQSRRNRSRSRSS